MFTRDLFPGMAVYLSLLDIGRLKQVSRNLYSLATKFEEQIILVNPALLVKFFAEFNARQLSKYLELNFWDRSDREAQLLGNVIAGNQVHASMACFALFGKRDKVVFYAREILACVSFLLANHYPANCSLMLSLGFLLEYNYHAHKEFFDKYKEAHINLRGTNLSECDLSNLSLNYANLREANLANAHFEVSSLRGSSLRYANLMGANFNAASLVDVDMRETYCRGAVFVGATLLSARLEGANLRTAVLRPWSPGWLFCASYYQYGQNHDYGDFNSAVLYQATYNSKTKFPLFFIKRLNEVVEAPIEKPSPVFLKAGQGQV